VSGSGWGRRVPNRRASGNFSRQDSGLLESCLLEHAAFTYVHAARSSICWIARFSAFGDSASTHRALEGPRLRSGFGISSGQRRAWMIRWEQIGRARPPHTPKAHEVQKRADRRLFGAVGMTGPNGMPGTALILERAIADLLEHGLIQPATGCFSAPPAAPRLRRRGQRLRPRGRSTTRGCG